MQLFRINPLRMPYQLEIKEWKAIASFVVYLPIIEVLFLQFVNKIKGPSIK